RERYKVSSAAERSSSTPSTSPGGSPRPAARQSKRASRRGNGRRYVSERVPHPHVRLPVGAGAGLTVDADGCEAVGEPVFATLQERHLSPPLPVGDTASDLKRSRLGLEHRCAKPLVDAHPR